MPSSFPTVAPIFPWKQLGGKTPLQAARIPHMDAVAKQGMLAQTDNVPAHFPAGSEVANMTLFGYDPNTYFTGRAPIEAAAQGIQLASRRLGGALQSGRRSSIK